MMNDFQTDQEHTRTHVSKLKYVDQFLTNIPCINNFEWVKGKYNIRNACLYILYEYKMLFFCYFPKYVPHTHRHTHKWIKAIWWVCVTMKDWKTLRGSDVEKYMCVKHENVSVDIFSCLHS